jgi:transposase
LRTTRTSDWVRLASADDALDEAIETIDRELEVPARTGETARRPDDHSRRRPGHRPGASRHDPGLRRIFRRDGSFAAFLGPIPREHSTGGKPRLGRMTKMGDRYLRTVRVQAPAVPLATTKGII